MRKDMELSDLAFRRAVAFIIDYVILCGVFFFAWIYFSCWTVVRMLM